MPLTNDNLPRVNLQYLSVVDSRELRDVKVSLRDEDVELWFGSLSDFLIDNHFDTWELGQLFFCMLTNRTWEVLGPQGQKYFVDRVTEAEEERND